MLCTFVEVRMSCVDIGQLYSNNILHHGVCGHQSASQQVGHHVYDLLVKFGKPWKVKVNEELNGVRLEHKYFYNFFPKDNLKQVVVVKWISLLCHHISNIQYVSILPDPDYPD